MNLAMAGVMHQPQIREVVFAPALLRNHMMDVEVLAIFEVLVTDRTDTLLPSGKLPATKDRHLRLGSPLSPVVL